MKKSIILFAVTGISGSLIFTGCGAKDNYTAENKGVKEENVSNGDIKIVYTNDIHSYIANETEKEADNDRKKTSLRLSNVAEIVDDMEEKDENVFLVDVGDQIQGTVYGSNDMGKGVIKLMNATGYQLATPGNHDFDYGVSHFYEIAKKANFSYISCNFHSLNGKDPFEDSKIVEIGGKKIAFIGISTPRTMTVTAPVYFMNNDGEYIYSVDGLNDLQDLYDSVQMAIDAVKDQVDYVIALGHVGVGKNEIRDKISSTDVIANTTGLDAFIDGHSHGEIKGNMVEDKSGNNVLHTQAGAFLKNVGVMTISEDGVITTDLISAYGQQDEKVASMEEEFISGVDQVYDEKIAVLDKRLYVSDPDNYKITLIRSKEMNAGDFAADSIYWYFNEVKKNNCDIVLVDGDTLERSIVAGDVKIKDVKRMMPFGKTVCMIKATGQQIKDALEMGAASASQTNENAENKAFLQVAGIKYTIDTTISSGVKKDEQGMFTGVEGHYRVKDIQIYNRQTGKYEALNVNKVYTVGGTDFIFNDGANGLSMFKDCKVAVKNGGQDYEVMVDYIKNFNKDGDYPRINTAGSPLSAYSNYLINYENLNGAGRITFVR